MNQPASTRVMAINRTGPASVFTELTLPCPRPGIGQVLVRVRATSVNPIDVKIRAGAVPLAGEFPAILHGDMAGEVVLVGEGVSDFKAGDAVYGMIGGVQGMPGALAEYAVVDARLIAIKPRSLTFPEAAALPVAALTALEAVCQRAPQALGAHALIHAGTGGVGHIALQLARSAGMHVTTTVSGPEKAAIARKLGADEVVNYREEPVADYVARITGGRGFDLVIDTVGGDNLAASFAAARMGGNVICIAARGSHDLSLMHGRGLSLHVVFKLMPLLTGAHRERVGEDLATLAALADSGKFRPLLDEKIFPINRIAQAHERVESGKAIGKVVVEW
jgi:NADPH2:quinone reductase